MTSPQESWDPAQYNRFAAERQAPFWDLEGLLLPVERPRVVDLGCGDGQLTAALHERLGASSTLGVDLSPAMLDAARQRAGPTLSFVAGDIASWTGTDVDVVVSNAALHWVRNHPQVLARWSAALAPGGQLAVQVPANADHPAQLAAQELASEMLGERAPGDPVAENVLAPERYAELLEELGFERQHVRLQVYGHRLAGAEEVVEWVKGASLTRLKAVMTDDEFASFESEYRHRLARALGDRRPYFYAFKRILMWGART